MVESGKGLVAPEKRDNVCAPGRRFKPLPVQEGVHRVDVLEVHYHTGQVIAIGSAGGQGAEVGERVSMGWFTFDPR
jgi:hypothetical protein